MILKLRARDILAGDLGAHRDPPVDSDEPPEPAPPAAPAAARVLYSRDDAQRTWARRRADLNHLAGVDDLLNDVDARATELHQRTTAMLSALTAR